MNFDALMKILDDEVVFYVDELNASDVYVEYHRKNGELCFEPIKSKFFAAFLNIRYCQLV